jgi:hypothetical protein
VCVGLHTQQQTNNKTQFDVAEGVADDPIAVLAALFHDSVYFHVDGGISKLQLHYLNLFVEEEDEEEGDSITTAGARHNNQPQQLAQYHVKKPRPSRIKDEHNNNDNKDEDIDILLRMVECIFGYPLNTDVVTYRCGLNEFLSAMICVRLLHTLLPLRTLAEITCCIEATIPFRSNNTVEEECHDTTKKKQKNTTTKKEEDDDDYPNATPLGRLYQRLKLANTKFQLQMTTQDMVHAIQRAVRVANQDVANFASDDVLLFLDNTWDLLPETNTALRQQTSCTVYDVQFAVFKMYGFFHSVKPNVVFQQYQGIPCNDTLMKLQHQAKKNLDLGRMYVGVKLLALSVLAAFLHLTGGDAPVSFFVGDLSNHFHTDQEQPRHGDNDDKHKYKCRLFPNGPMPPTVNKTEMNCTVYKILMDGRRSETSFDIRQSPLAAYLYGCLGDCQVNNFLTRPHAKWETLHPMTQETALALLKELPKDCVQTVGNCVKAIAPSRRTALDDVLQEIFAEKSGVNSPPKK